MNAIRHIIPTLIPFLFWVSAGWVAVALGMLAIRAWIGGRSFGWQAFRLIAYCLFWFSLSALSLISVVVLVFHKSLGIVLPFGI
jgi:hypothetical protein